MKELVVDIDISDYNDVRTCCKENSICEICWEFMSCAIKVIDTILREDFGFNNLLWTFSGRRGVHCWVSDKRAKLLSDENRFAIAQYLSIDRRGARENIKKIIASKHFSLKRAYFLCKESFLLLAESQNWFSIKKYLEIILEYLPKGLIKLKKEIKEKWLGDLLYESAKTKFDLLENYLRDDKNFLGKRKFLRNDLLISMQEIIFKFVYPRIDLEVTKKLNHLLKSPFVVHPKTGYICVPIEIRNVNSKKEYNIFSELYEHKWNVQSFDLKKIPRLDSLINALNLPNNHSNQELNTFLKNVNYFKNLTDHFN